MDDESGSEADAEKEETSVAIFSEELKKHGGRVSGERRVASSKSSDESQGGDGDEQKEKGVEDALRDTGDGPAAGEQACSDGRDEGGVENEGGRVDEA